MKRSKLIDQDLPGFSHGEELFHMVSHIVGGGLAVLFCVACVIKAFLRGGAYEIVAAFLYGLSMITLYTMSGLYHGLREGTTKPVFQIPDHCTIFLLIAGTYTPIVLCALRSVSLFLGWPVFGVVWGLSALGILFNSIDLNRYAKLSMTLYILLGWCIVLTGRQAILAMGIPCFRYMPAGGISYTVGAVFYGIGGMAETPIAYMHAIFHLFVILGSTLHFPGIFLYIL